MIVTLTGYAGFIGSQVLKDLYKRNDVSHIYAIDNLSKPAIHDDDFRKCVADRERVTCIVHDLRDTETENRAWYAFKRSDHVLALASQLGGISYFHKRPAEIIRNNGLIITNTLDAIIKCNKDAKLTYVSSSMVYERATKFPSKEEDVDAIPKPITAYGFSKLQGEEYCRAYADQYGLKYTIVRPFNSIGVEKPKLDEPGFSHILPDLIARIHSGQGTKDNPLEIFGDGKQVRHYTYVEDVSEGILAAAFNGKADGEAFNISTPLSHSVIDLATIVYAKMRHIGGGPHIKFTPGFQHDVKYRSPDVSKAKKMLGFEAKFAITDVIDSIIEAIVNNL